MSEVKIFRSVAVASVLAIAASLAACQQSEAPADNATEAADSGNPDAKPGISGSDGRMILPVVAGRPGAVYFTIRNDGPQSATLVGVHVAGAGEVQMHKTEGGRMTSVDSLEIAPGGILEFAPGGYHVMAFDIDDTLKSGENAELTLTFSDGDKLSMPLTVETMGGGMDHAGMEGGSMDDGSMAEMHH
ncbi:MULTISPECIES: copper chaperone PCu(A)C [Novosphingobium]